MRFELLKREIDMKWRHIFLVLGVSIALAIVFLILAIAVGLAAGDVSVESLILSALALQIIMLIVGQPIRAFIFLAAAPAFGLKKDVALCRGVAAASFLIIGVPEILAAAAALFLALVGQQYVTVSSLIGSALSLAAGTVILYLWMLIFLKLDSRRFRNATRYAVIATLIIFLVMEGLAFVKDYHLAGIPYSTEFGLEAALALIGIFLFCLVLIYHAPKELDDAAAVFAIIYIGSSAFYGVEDFMAGGLGGLTNVIEAVVSLGIIYLLSRNMLSREL